MRSSVWIKPSSSGKCPLSYGIYAEMIREESEKKAVIM